MQKRGQTTVFIILAIVIVVFGILIYFFYPQVSSALGFSVAPSAFMSECIQSEVLSGVDLLSKQGGYANPEGYITYEGQNVKYLCYTSQYYIPCYVQQPLLRAHFEQELAQLLKTKAESCATELENYYKSRGYTVSRDGETGVSVTIVPEKISVVVSAPMTVTKENTQKFREFRFEEKSNMYSLLMTATSIIDFESTYGDSETTSYMQYYPNLKIQKNKLGDGSKIYTLSDVTSGESFTFASRSLAWPGGYGLSG